FFLLMSLLFIGFAAGSYPAFYISGFRPTSILKGTFKISGTNKLTQILLTLQFSISIMAIISGMAFYQNALYQEELDYGFNKDGVIFARFEKAADVQKFKNTLEGHTAVTAIAESNHHFFSSYFRDPVQFEEQLREVDVMDVTNDYINVVGMKMLEGRNFTEDSESDRREGIIVNEEFIKTFGWKEAIGKRVVWRDTISLFVVGVVKDFYTRGLWNPIEPMMMKYAAEENYRHLIVSANVPDLVKVNEYMKEQWKELFPGTLYTGEFMDEEIEEASTINNNIIKVFLFLGAIALLLSAIGLYSLVSLNIIKKMKEIGIRKVHGASVFHIIQKVNKEFAIILIISFVFGIGGGYYMVKMLMQSIWSYYQDSNAITYLGAILLIIIVAMVTVGYKIYKAATTNPVHVLRDE
ncbi:MAG: ABC transporter permease, partial [Cyclobacteriaceae bacterium]|nr:ABC transporter permease [Cyclobacteriaceae bacterium]